LKRSDDWLKQAKKDILHSKESLKIQHHEWAVFAAQQGAEKAIKALFHEIGADARGHSLFFLLKKLPQNFHVSDKIMNSAKSLDKHYITSRYPNSFASGAPEDYYTKEEAEEAIKNGEEIFKFCERQISSLREGTS